MPVRGPKEWSPRPDPAEEFRETAEELIGLLKGSGDSQSYAIGDVLEGAYQDGQLDKNLAVSILDAFIESAKWAKKEIKRIKKRRS